MFLFCFSSMQGRGQAFLTAQRKLIPLHQGGNRSLRGDKGKFPPFPGSPFNSMAAASDSWGEIPGVLVLLFNLAETSLTPQGCEKSRSSVNVDGEDLVSWSGEAPGSGWSLQVGSAVDCRRLPLEPCSWVISPPTTFLPSPHPQFSFLP